MYKNAKEVNTEGNNRLNLIESACFNREYATRDASWCSQCTRSL